MPRTRPLCPTVEDWNAYVDKYATSPGSRLNKLPDDWEPEPRIKPGRGKWDRATTKIRKLEKPKRPRGRPTLPPEKRKPTYKRKIRRAKFRPSPGLIEMVVETVTGIPCAALSANFDCFTPGIDDLFSARKLLVFALGRYGGIEPGEILEMFPRLTLSIIGTTISKMLALSRKKVVHHSQRKMRAMIDEVRTTLNATAGRGNKRLL